MIDHEIDKRAYIGENEPASFTYPTCGKQGVATALDILNGKKVARFIPVPFQLVTRDNVNEIKTIY